MTESSPIAFVAIGDLHLDHRIWRSRHQIQDDALVAFRSIIDITVELNVPLVLLGDLFNVPDPESSLVRFFRSEMERLHAAGLSCYAIQGNHDRRPVPWYTAVSPYPIHVGDGRWVTIGGIPTVGFDYASRDDIADKLRDLQRDLIAANVAGAPEIPRVLLLHQGVRQALGFEGAWNCDLDWVPDEIPLTLMGDIHVCRSIGRGDGRSAWYSGSSHARNIDEIGPKGLLAVHRDLTVEPVEIDYRRFTKAVWTTISPPTLSVDQLVDQARQNVSESIPELPSVIWVQYTADRRPMVVDLAHRLRELNVILVEEPIVLGQLAPMVERTSGDHLPSIPRLLGRLLNPEKDRAAFNLVLDLVDPSANTQERLQAQRERFFATRQVPQAA